MMKEWKETESGRLGFFPFVFIPKMFQGMTGVFFKLFSQMALGREAEIGGNFNIGILGIN